MRRCALISLLASGLALAGSARAELWGYVDGAGVAHVAARPLNSRYSLVLRDREIYFVYGRQGAQEGDLDNTLFHYKYSVTAPSKLAGSALLVEETIDQVMAIRKAWRFNRGERRVRRLPMLAYDAMQPDTNGMATADVVDAYNGAPDRYEWTLVGKQEMLVPYNSYAVHQKGIAYEKILQAKHVNPELLRHELHRVWVVEAAVKGDKRHSFAKRVFYIDEDSWALLHVDMYDAKGNLWRVQEGSLWAAPEVGACMSYEYQMYDLVARRYVTDNWTAEGEVLDLTAGKEGRVNAATFSQDELRRRGER